MQSWILAALLTLQCLVPLASTSWQSTSYSDAGSFSTVGFVTFKGSRLRIFEIDGTRVAEPRVAFTTSCGSVRFNHLYQKYQLSIDVRVDANTLTSRAHGSTKVGQVTLTGLQVAADKALTSRDARITVLAQVKRSGKGLLILLCDSFEQCQSLRTEVATNPEELQNAVEFLPIGLVGNTKVRFGPTMSDKAPRISDCNSRRWVVFQRRVDGSVSFAQKWDAYEKGFGNPKSNYWMGLKQLFAMTVTSMDGNSFRCRLRIETEDLKGKKYWGEYAQFEVLSPQENYELRIKGMVRGSTIRLMYHNGMKFSTYDRDHDKYGKGSCSRHHGYGGWWYNKCHEVNLNGAYTTNRSIRGSPNFVTVNIGGYFISMKKTLMKFRCT